MERKSNHKDLIIPGPASFDAVCDLLNSINEISISNRNELLPKILETICRFVETDGILLYHYDKQNIKRTLISNKFCTNLSIQEHVEDENIQFPELRKLFLTNEIIKIENLNELPENALDEKTFLQRININSFITLPFKAERERYGVFAFSINEHHWDENIVTYLNLIRKILTNALTKLKTLEMLEDGTNKFQTIADNTFSMEKWRSPRGELLYVSPNCKRLTGHSQKEFYSGKINLMNLVIDDDRELWGNRRNEFNEIDLNEGIEYRILCRDKTEKWILETGMKVVDENNVFLGWRSSFLDISEKKELEEKLRKSQNEVKTLNTVLKNENELPKQNLIDTEIPGFVTKDPKMLKILEAVKQVAATDSPVLISGETGTGKELIARAVHQLSKRNSVPLVTVNCAAIPNALLESELFGREKGAYTGALSKQVGRFQIANKSSIFLDEIGELPYEVQSKLLRVLQFGEFQMLGSHELHKVDARIICATNRDLKEEIEKNTFREDLYYRINVFPINLPPLRERKNDIPSLAWEFAKELSKKIGKRISRISSASIEKMLKYSWPGNLRELRNVIEYSLIISNSSILNIELHDNVSDNDFGGLKLQEVEKNHIIKILKQTGWKIRGENGASEILGVNESTLRFRMKKLGITKDL